MFTKIKQNMVMSNVDKNIWSKQLGRLNCPHTNLQTFKVYIFNVWYVFLPLTKACSFFNKQKKSNFVTWGKFQKDKKKIPILKRQLKKWTTDYKEAKLYFSDNDISGISYNSFMLLRVYVNCIFIAKVYFLLDLY